MYETIDYKIHNNTAWITLNRPGKLNAFIAQMNHDIRKAIKKAAADKTVRCIVITGNGRAFCSGQDLSEVDESMDHGDVLRNHYGPMVKEIHQCEKPIIAAINGVAAGAGLSLALACDFRLASSKASLIQAFIHVGLIPDTANLYYLTRLVGYAKALELAVLGEKISAADAKEIGLVNEVFSEDEFEEKVSSYADRIAALPTKAISLIKRNLKESYDVSFEDYLENEAQGQRIVGLTKDHKEGVQAFLEKRKANFIGE